MPRQRDVKPWTIYPPTQEDRKIIEQKAAAASLSVSAYLCMLGKLACVAVDFPTTTTTTTTTTVAEPVLSEPVIEQPAEPTYTFTDQYGKPLKAALEKIIREEFEAGRFDPQQEQEQDFYGELTAKKSGKRGKLYLCTKPDPDRGLDYGTEFRVIKEV